MAKLETFIDLHDALVDLLQTFDRRGLVELLCRVTEVPLPASFAVVERTPIVEFPALGKHRKKRIADLVLEVRGHKGETLITFVIEVQETYSGAKGHDWMIFAVGFASRYDRKAKVVIVTPKPRLREQIGRLVARIDEPIYMMKPDHIERIDDDALARMRPRATILAALFYAGEASLAAAHRVASVRAALIALEQVDHGRWLSYFALLMSTAPPAIGEPALESALESGSIDAERLAANWALYQGGTLHAWAKREGREEGRVEGRAAALRVVIARLLALRELDTDERLARVERCKDPEVLARWFDALTSRDARGSTQPADEPRDLLSDD